MTLGNVDGFESYRRERERRRRMSEDGARQVVPGALRELQEVEAREERDRVLNQDVHDFFEAATRTAASIVRKVAENAKVEVEERLSQEMEEFLLESLERMQTLVASVLGRARGQEAEELMEPSMRNLVGRVLDEFRIAGTAAGNKHLGEDPQATDLDAVRREFQTKSGAPAAEDTAPIVPVSSTLGLGTPAEAGPALPAPETKPETPPIEQHLAAELLSESQAGEQGKKRGKARKGRKVADEAAAAAEHDLDRFMEALKTLVQQGKMSREEARAAWETRLASRNKS